MQRHRSTATLSLEKRRRLLPDTAEANDHVDQLIQGNNQFGTKCLLTQRENPFATAQGFDECPRHDLFERTEDYYYKCDNNLDEMPRKMSSSCVSSVVTGTPIRKPASNLSFTPLTNGHFSGWFNEVSSDTLTITCQCCMAMN